jgi:hypothetical protein
VYVFNIELKIQHSSRFDAVAVSQTDREAGIETDIQDLEKHVPKTSKVNIYQNFITDLKLRGDTAKTTFRVRFGVLSAVTLMNTVSWYVTMW